MRLKVTTSFEYDADPEHYPDDMRTPTKMAQLDIGQEPAILLEGDAFSVSAVEVIDVN